MDLEWTRRTKLIFEGSDLAILRKGLYASAIRYAQMRSEWKLLTVGERVDRDPTRTAAHNAFIDACNILSRNMAEAGEDTDWRIQLGNDRKTIGDFACYLSCLLGIEAR